MIPSNKEEFCCEKWFQKLHMEFGEQVVESKGDKSSLYNVLAEGMYF